MGREAVDPLSIILPGESGTVCKKAPKDRLEKRNPRKELLVVMLCMRLSGMSMGEHPGVITR